MGLLLFLGLVVLLIYFVTRNSKPGGRQNFFVDQQLEIRNQEWATFIAGYRVKAKTKSQKEFLEQMLADIAAQGLPVPNDSELKNLEAAYIEHSPPTQPARAFASQVVSPVVVTEFAVPQEKVNTPIDNATLLLYFGAFLFVASVGLFIVFGKAGGTVRTAAVFLVMAVMYGSGVWLFRHKPKLRPAGLAFAGIGIATAPLVGLAAYSYVLTGHAQEVWFLTSILCIGLYAHALVTLRRPLINYIFIFTFLSLFESGISIVNAPIYYFGWAMALTGMLLQLTSKLKGFWPEIQESSRVSSQLFLPLSLLVSVVLVPTHGVGQLGVSLLLAAAFYGLEAWSTQEDEQATNAIASHVAFLAGVTCVVFAMNHSWLDAGISLLLINIVQMMSLWFIPKIGQLARNYASVLMLAGGASALFLVQHPSMFLLSVRMLVLIGISVWLIQKRYEAYALAAVAWTAIPLVYGQLVASPRLSLSKQSAVLFMALIFQLAVFLLSHNRYKKDESWLEVARAVYLIGAGTVMVVAVIAGSSTSIVLSLLTALTMALIAEYDTWADWAVLAGLTASASMFNTVQNHELFLISTLVALACNIGLALRYRQELNRWFSTILWLIVPYSLGSSAAAGLHWGVDTYAWAYMVVMAVLILSRAIARGVVFASSRIPLASFARSASLSYVFGYTSAAVLAVGISLTDSASSRVHTTAIILACSLATYMLSIHIEKRADIISFLPLLGQFALWSAIRPTILQGGLSVFLVASSVLAAAGYYFAIGLAGSNGEKTKNQYAPFIKGASLIAVFITPLSFIFAGHTLWPMPPGLLLAGYLVYHYVRNTTQENRELAGGLLVLAGMWFLWLVGVRQLQAYTHIAALTFGAYAYWRAYRHEMNESDMYLKVMLATATVPLALQALSGHAGGLYGWWLLLEEIAFMLLGMSIRKRYVTFWGLYVAIGAVLYQLRHLGWAALTVLAVFLISLAVYRLQRYNQVEHK